MLSKVKQVLEKHCKTLKALVIFGSHVYSPPRSRDIDILVVVDRLDNAKEKKLIELEILKNLRSLELCKPIDVVVLDIEMLKENAEPGGLISGLILGCRPIYDELGMPAMVEKILQRISEEGGYTIIKNSKRLNLAFLAKVKKQHKKDTKTLC